MTKQAMLTRLILMLLQGNDPAARMWRQLIEDSK